MSPLKPERHSAITAADIDRRAALKLLASGMALSLASCGKPREEIVPYVEQPERVVPGIPLRFATTLDLSGYGRGAIVTSVEGRPIKIEGNPRHPASLGSTDVFAEAEVLSLYDPDRSKAVRGAVNVESWDAFASALRMQMEKEKVRAGAGLRILSGRIASPTLARQRDALLKQYPKAQWYRYEPVSDDLEIAGAQLAFSKPLLAIPRFGEAAVVLALDSDWLGPGPQQISNARGFATARRQSSDPDRFQRLYVVEPAWSATGANADHRLALRPELIRNVAIAVVAHLRNETPSIALPAEAEKFARYAADDLKSRQGHALVVAGLSQPPEVHALCHSINHLLAAPVDLIEPVDPGPMHADSLRALASDLTSSQAQTLILLGCNPAYDTPGELNIGKAIAAAPFSVHLGLHRDETASVCRWHLPLSHPLESWSDRRAVDGTASIVQPLIRPLYDTRTTHDVVAMLGGVLTPLSYDMVRETWHGSASGDFETWWRQTLHDGVVPNSRSQPVSVAPKNAIPAAATLAQQPILQIMPDPCLWDGRAANNAWLQECPKPLTKAVWGNMLSLSPVDAAKLNCTDGDVVELRAGGYAVEAPVQVSAGQAEGIYATTLGYGRTHAGAIGNGIGFDVYPMRRLAAPWLIEGVTLHKTGRTRAVPETQSHFQIDAGADDILPSISLLELARGLDRKPFTPEPQPTLNPPYKYDSYAWAMVIDTAACIGCNACVVACQAENNVPVVGPEEVEAGRDMHWLRVDIYDLQHNSRGFQPVPCMQCEHAPCEPVCPVAASVHDGEGLNVQVYNRCVGTRFCQSNCPYKVRRFNWYGYADGQEYKNLGAKSVTAQHNPNVTVRSRGVMEKCTYCVQRISAARRTAEKENREIHDGEVVTACQAACPTRAISFGNKNDPQAQVNAKREEKQHYALLDHLGTRPRTTYLARLRNPNPAFGESGA